MKKTFVCLVLALGCVDSTPGDRQMVQDFDVVDDAGVPVATLEGDDAMVDDLVGPEVICESFDLVNPSASERVNAALCFGLGVSDFICELQPSLDVLCLDPDGKWYQVRYMDDSDGVTIGEIYGGDATDRFGTTAALVHQAVDGAFVYLEPGSGDLIARCSVLGSTANLCSIGYE